MTIIANFTSDDISFFHAGVQTTIPAYQEGSEAHVIDMDTGKASHALNEYSKIGLVKMEFGDDPETKKAEGIAQNKRFWIHQIEVYNEQNEQQRHGGRAYHKPTSQLRVKADLYGLELKAPWTAPKKDDAEVSALKAENEKLKAAMEEKDKTAHDQGKLIAQIMARLDMSEPEPMTEEEYLAQVEIAVKGNRKRYISLTNRSLPGWVVNNWDEIHSEEYPEENKFEIYAKYEETCGVPFPAECPA